MNKNYIIIHVDYIGNVIDFPLTMNLILSMNAQNESCLYLGSFKKTFRITVSLHNSELNSLQLQIVSLLNWFKLIVSVFYNVFNATTVGNSIS